MLLLTPHLHQNTFSCTLPRGITRHARAGRIACVALLATLSVMFSVAAFAQTGGDGAIEGTVSDKSGAMIAHAVVTATNLQTGVKSVRETTGAGFYSASPLPAGKYSVQVTANGFQKQLQENIQVDALNTVGLNIKMTVGAGTQEITVTTAPPLLDTTNATLGGTIENDMYSQLPLSMNGGPRDPTAFAYLMPGTSEGSSGRGVYGGSGQANLNETYLDGMPLTDASAQGNGKQISQAVSVDSVDQFQVQTNGSPVSIQGAGATNYTLKTGSNVFHGTVFDYVRNTIFDSWGYFSKLPSKFGPATKPVEHQNSYGASLGGPIIKDKLFFFGTYEGFHYTRTSNTPQYISIPTLLERAGDFTEVLGTASAGKPVPNQIYDPVTESQCTAANKGRNCRYPVMGMKNGVPTANVLPAGEISPIAQYLESALPTPTNSQTQSNYLAGLPLGNANYTINGRIDYTISPRNNISIIGVGGNRGFINGPDYTTSSVSPIALAQLPVPYAAAIFSNQRTASGIIDYNFVASTAVVNQLKYGYSRSWGPAFSPTYNSKFTATAAGITGLPAGNASQTFPGEGFGVGGPGGWASNQNSGPGGVNTYTLMDTVQWVKGAHSMSFGAQMQWLETNGAAFGGYSSTINLNYSNIETAQYTTTGTAVNTITGFGYASYLLGAVDGTNVKIQSITDVGGRYKAFAPFFQDNWRVTPKLTLNLGLRWDLLTPYHEVQNRIAFLDRTAINPAVGIPGTLIYGGHGANTCNCSTEVKTYYGNYEPRLGLAYAPTEKWVIRAGFGITTTHAGGVGGRQNATTGAGTNEFNAINVYGRNANAPSFWLNPNAGVHASTSFPAYQVPTNTLNPAAGTGNYIPAGSKVALAPQAPTYADTYLGGRGPQFMNWNIGFERALNKTGVLNINYAASQTHFLTGGGIRGSAQDTYPASYASMSGGGLLLGDLLGQPANNTDPNTKQTYLQDAQKIIPGLALPYAGFTGRYATVAALLVPFPQYSHVIDIWGNAGNANYNSLQISMIQRPWNGLLGMINYTRAKEIDDTGYHRSAFPVGPQDGNFTHQYKQDRVDRHIGGQSQTNNLSMTGVYLLPFGRGQRFGATSRVANILGAGWNLSGIYRYRDGYPITIFGGSGVCDTPGQGTCFPDYNPSFGKKDARIHGPWGKAGNALTAPTVQYIDPNAFQTPTKYKLGNIAGAAPYNLTGPGYWNIDSGVRRTIPIHDNITFTLEVDVFNLTNSTFFNLSNATTTDNLPPVLNPTAKVINTGFGTIAGQSNVPRDWQVAGRISF